MRLDKINDKSFVDIPSSEPAVKFPLQRVGVTNRPHYIKVIDPFSSENSSSENSDKNTMDLWSHLKIYFSLPAHQRGVHMSRIEEALHYMRNKAPVKFKDYSIQLKDHLIELQKISNCELSITSEYEKSTNKNRSGKESIELIKLHHSVKYNSSELKQKIGVTVPFINACPCTQRWAIREYYNTLTSEGRTNQETEALVKNAPRQAHTNRGSATIMVESELVTHPEIYQILDESVPIIRELLKGTDEHDLVRRTHQDGMFCEDNIRSIASKLTEKLGPRLPISTNISITVEVDESVHHHNLFAEVSESLEYFISALKPS